MRTLNASKMEPCHSFWQARDLHLLSKHRWALVLRSQCDSVLPVTMISDSTSLSFIGWLGLVVAFRVLRQTTSQQRLCAFVFKEIVTEQRFVSIVVLSLYFNILAIVCWTRFVACYFVSHNCVAFVQILTTTFDSTMEEACTTRSNNSIARLDLPLLTKRPQWICFICK